MHYSYHSLKLMCAYIIQWYCDYEWKTCVWFCRLASSVKALPFNLLLSCDSIWWHGVWPTSVSGNGLFPDGTKPLTEPMLTYAQFGSATYCAESVNDINSSLKTSRKRISSKSWMDQWVKGLCSIRTFKIMISIKTRPVYSYGMGVMLSLLLFLHRC